MLCLRFYLVVSEPNIPPGSMHVRSPIKVVLAEALLAAHLPPRPQLTKLSPLVCQWPGYVCCIWKCMHFQTHCCIWKCMHFQMHVSTESVSAPVVLHLLQRTPAMLPVPWLKVATALLEIWVFYPISWSPCSQQGCPSCVPCRHGTLRPV
jgi:hypothetical protein